MPQEDNWHTRQFVERIKDVARMYDRFCITREIEDFDKAYFLYEEINKDYEISFDLLEFVEIGRAWLAKQTLPHTLE